MAYKYSYGDEVIYNGLPAKITSIWFNYMGDENIRIEFDDPSISPNYKEVVSTQIKPRNSKEDNWYDKWVLESEKKKYIGSPKTYCQKCGDKWVEMEHPIFGKKIMWYHCIKCNTKREDYYKE